MNKLRLCLVLLLCITAMLCFSNSVNAGTGFGSISLIKGDAEPGKDVTVDLTLADNPGTAYLAFTFTYDTNIITYSRYVKPNKNFSEWQINASIPGEIKAIWVDSNGQNNDTNGAVLQLIFHIADNASGKLPISVMLDEAWDENDDPVRFGITESLSEVGIGPSVSYEVTFKVINGSWNDTSIEDITVTLKGKTGSTLRLKADQIPNVGNKPFMGFTEGFWDIEPNTGTVITGSTVYTYTYSKKETVSYTVTFKVMNGSWDDGTIADQDFMLFGYKDELKLFADDIPAVGSKPNEGYKAGTWDVTPDTENALGADTTYTYTYAEGSAVAGDLNGDKTVDVFDLVQLRNFIMRPSATVIYANPDTNGDNTTDVFDLVQLRNYIMRPGEVVIH